MTGISEGGVGGQKNQKLCSQWFRGMKNIVAQAVSGLGFEVQPLKAEKSVIFSFYFTFLPRTSPYSIGFLLIFCLILDLLVVYMSKKLLRG